MMPVRLRPTAPRSRVKHSTTEPLRSQKRVILAILKSHVALVSPTESCYQHSSVLTLFILMNFPVHIDTISMDLLILYLWESQGQISKFLYISLSLKIAYILANSADPDEMPPKATFHLVRHCLPQYLFISIQNEKG